MLKFDCSNAFNTMPRQLILDAVLSRAPALGPVAASWLGLATTHFFWGEGSQAGPVEATKGVDQGCPLSPALFAIGLAGSLERVNSRLSALSPSCRVFSYLDDVHVVLPGGHADEAMTAVIAELEGAVGER